MTYAVQERLTALIHESGKEEGRLLLPSIPLPDGATFELGDGRIAEVEARIGGPSYVYWGRPCPNCGKGVVAEGLARAGWRCERCRTVASEQHFAYTAECEHRHWTAADAVQCAYGRDKPHAIIVAELFGGTTRALGTASEVWDNWELKNLRSIGAYRFTVLVEGDEAPTVHASWPLAENGLRCRHDQRNPPSWAVLVVQSHMSETTSHLLHRGMSPDGAVGFVFKCPCHEGRRV